MSQSLLPNDVEIKNSIIDIRKNQAYQLTDQKSLHKSLFSIQYEVLLNLV